MVRHKLSSVQNASSKLAHDNGRVAGTITGNSLRKQRLIAKWLPSHPPQELALDLERVHEGLGCVPSQFRLTKLTRPLDRLGAHTSVEKSREDEITTEVL